MIVLKHKLANKCIYIDNHHIVSYIKANQQYNIYGTGNNHNYRSTLYNGILN